MNKALLALRRKRVKAHQKAAKANLGRKVRETLRAAEASTSGKA
jgi:hypothetical protein